MLLLTACASRPVAYRLADGGEVVDQQLVVMSNLHQLDTAVAVINTPVGLGLQQTQHTCGQGT